MDSPVETISVLHNRFETVRHIAKANGNFYNSFLDAYLTDGLPENRNPQIAQLVENLPPSARKLYIEGINRYQEELVANHNLLETQRGHEVSYLLGDLLRSEGKAEADISDILNHATAEKARYVEPSPGVAIIETEEDFFNYLQEREIISHAADMVCCSSDNRREPSFLIVKRDIFGKSLSEEGVSAAQKSSVRHEFHHFIWNFLERSNFVRPVAESSPELATAFKHFRDELSAYIVQGRLLDEINTKLLAYTDDGDILHIATDVKNFAAVCMKLARQVGVEPQTFLYASMFSRNFNELKTNFGILTPLEGEVRLSTMEAMFDVWSENKTLVKEFQELLKQNGVIFSPQLVSQLNVSRLGSPKHNNVRDLYYELDRLNEFALITGSSPVDSEVFRNTLKTKLQLPEATIDVILKQAIDLTEKMPLTNSPEDFVREYISFWRINEEMARSAYSQILASAPKMKDVFYKVRDEIIYRGARAYRREMSNPERKEKTEAEIQERIQFLLSL